MRFLTLALIACATRGEAGIILATNDLLDTVAMLDTNLQHASPVTLIDVVHPEGIAVDEAGNVYVSTFPTNQILKFSTSGVSMGVFTTSVNSPRGLAFDLSGNLWVANAGFGTVSEFSPTGAFIRNALTPSFDPRSPTFDSLGNLYVLDSFLGEVHKYSSDGNDLGVFASVNSSSLGGLAVDAAGNVYVSSTSGVRRFSSTGTDLGLFATVQNPDALVFDELGNLYVAAFGGYIRRFSPAGVDLGDFTVLSFGTGYYSALAFVPTPEPSTSILAALGLGSLVLGKLRSKGASKENVLGALHRTGRVPMPLP